MHYIDWKTYTNITKHALSTKCEEIYLNALNRNTVSKLNGRNFEQPRKLFCELILSFLSAIRRLPHPNSRTCFSSAAVTISIYFIIALSLYIYIYVHQIYIY